MGIGGGVVDGVEDSGGNGFDDWAWRTTARSAYSGLYSAVIGVKGQGCDRAASAYCRVAQGAETHQGGAVHTKCLSLAGDVGVLGGGQGDFDVSAFFAHSSVGKRVFGWFRLEVPWIGDLNLRFSRVLRIA